MMFVFLTLFFLWAFDVKVTRDMVVLSGAVWLLVSIVQSDVFAAFVNGLSGR